MMKKRKLIPREKLIEMNAKRLAGVPVARLVREYRLTITSGTLVRLLDIYANSSLYVESVQERVTESMFPAWLDADSSDQLQPDNYRYEGVFPTGFWTEIVD